MFTVKYLAAEIVLAQEHTLDNRIVDAKAAVSRDKAPAPTRYLVYPTNYYSAIYVYSSSIALVW